MPESCWGPLCGYIHWVSQWLKIHIVPIAPLITPTVAIIAGFVAVASIIITMSIARKRAAIDFFLKTDMDAGMVAAHAAFQTALKALEKHEAEGKTIETFVKGADGADTAEYKNIITYLNVHELVAVGIKNKVFNHDVCYNFWSDALVRHTDKTRKLIEYEASSEGGEASFFELRTLSIKWKERIRKWQEKQRRKSQ
jgi:hypothetical protein